MMASASLTHCVITAPSEAIAATYNALCNDLKGKVSEFSLLDILVVADPAGCRIGSGGGTLNALLHFISIHGVEVLRRSKVAIIHSGGDSRRAPLHTICGKAWAGLNCFTGESAALGSPLAVLLHELSIFCANMQEGSLVIASSDVLLDICHGCPTISFPDDSVAIVSVPEDIKVAKNHGVIVLNPDCNGKLSSCTIQQAHKYLQKPTIEELWREGAILKQGKDSSIPAETATDFALIDTGVVVFTGTACQAFAGLLQVPYFKGCTFEGVLAGTPVLRLELYSDILFALSCSSEANTLESYSRLLKLSAPLDANQASSVQHQALISIWEQLHSFPLVNIAIPTGLFVHLGTSREFADMLLIRNSSSSSATDVESPPVAAQPSKFQHFAEKYQLRRSVHAHTLRVGGGAVESNSPGVAINSLVLLNQDEDSKISNRSIIENSVLSGCVHLGEDAIVSHVPASLGHNFRCLDGILVQSIPLMDRKVAILVLGIDDDVKAHHSSTAATVCGVSWESFCQVTKLHPDDIWSGIAEGERSLWNAKLYSGVESAPTVGDSNFDVTWLQYVREVGTSSPQLLATVQVGADLVRASLPWKAGGGSSSQSSNCFRYSLSDLLCAGNAGQMRCWRKFLTVLNGFEGADADDHHKNVQAVARDCSSHAHLSEFSRLVSVVFVGVMDTVHNVEGIISPLVASPSAEAEGSNYATEFLTKQQRQQLRFSQATAIVLGVYCHALVSGQGINLEVNPLSSAALNAILTSLSVSLDNSFKAQLLDQVRMLYDNVNECNPASPVAGMNGPLCLKFLKSIAGTTACERVANALLSCGPSVGLPQQPRMLIFVGWLMQESNLFVSQDSWAQMSRRIADMRSSLTCETYARVIFEHLQSLAFVPGGARNHSARHVSNSIRHVTDVLEETMQMLVCKHIQFSLDSFQGSGPRLRDAVHAGGDVITVGKTVVATSPVRIDWAGGWSDTPPICYAEGGSVLNVAVEIDGKRPVSCCARFISERVIRLRVLGRAADGVGVAELDTVDCIHPSDFCDLGPHTQCGLLRAALVVVGVVDPEQADPWFLGRHGLEVACCSLLPAGSGMGGSSVLAACILAALGRLFGRPSSQDTLVQQTSQVEQLLTTGGGWQDQVGAIFGGFKIGRSLAGLPLQVQVTQLPCSPELQAALERRLVLVYSGQQRLAKDTLIRTLRKYSIMSLCKHDHASNTEVVSVFHTVTSLIQGAEKGAQTLIQAQQNNDALDSTIEALAATLNRYWELKVAMASASEPPYITHILNAMRPLCSGLSLCGAGAGGFIVLLLKADKSVEDVRSVTETHTELSVHGVSICQEGITSKDMILEESVPLMSMLN